MNTLRIFVSSPGDVGEERSLAGRVITRLQAEFGARITLEPIFWEHEPLRATASFQKQIPHPSQTDIAIFILWSRLGTRLPEHIHRPDGSLYQPNMSLKMRTTDINSWENPTCWFTARRQSK